MDRNQKTHLPAELHCGPDHIDKTTPLQDIKTETTPLRPSNCTKAIENATPIHNTLTL